MMIGPKVKELIIMLTGQCIRENGWKTNSMERELRVGLTVQNILELTSVGRRKASEISNGLIMPLMKESLKITRYLKKIDDYLHEEFKKAEKIMKSYKQFNYLLSSKYLHHQKVNRIHKLIEVFS